MTDASPQDSSQRIADAQSFQATCESIAGTFGELLALMPDGIIISDTSGKIVLANPQAEQLFGYERGELVSLTIERLVPESLRKRHLQQRNAYISSPCSRPMGQGGKLFGCRRQGDQFPVEISLSPMRTEAGLLICAAVRDVTDQRRIEEELLAQRSELTHAARLSTLGEMAAGMAHELNQPLTAMSAFAEGALVRLQRGRLSQTEITSVFSRISADAQRAGDIIKRLREFVQKRETRRHRIDVNQLIRDSYKFVESDAKHEGITIHF
jgi:two-component system sensor kinase FixL